MIASFSSGSSVANVNGELFSWQSVVSLPSELSFVKQQAISHAKGIGQCVHSPVLGIIDSKSLPPLFFSLFFPLLLQLCFANANSKKFPGTMIRKKEMDE